MAKKREISMLNKTQFKESLFDAVTFTYTLAVTFFAGWLLASSLGVDLSAYDQDFFVANVPKISLFLVGIMGALLWLNPLLYKVGLRTIGLVLFGPQTPTAQKSFLKTFHGLHLLVIFLLTFYVSISVTEASLDDLLDPDGLSGAARLWLGLADPNWSILPKAIVKALETIFIAFLATTLAIPVAFFLAFFASKNLMRTGLALSIYTTLRIALNLSRSVEPLVWALIFTVWVGVGPFAGMLALFLHSVASLIKYYSEVIEGISEGPLEAIRSTGANNVQVVWFGVVPQIVLPYIAMTLYRWDTNVRMATVIGLVGGGGIGTLLITYQGQAMWHEVGCIILVIAAIVWLMDAASALIREALK